MKHVAVDVDWYGPYVSVKEAAQKARGYYGAGLYLVIGKVRHQKNSSCPQYIGIARELANRLYTSAGIKEVTRDRRIWLGEVASINVPGKKSKMTNTQIDLAEWCHAYFLQLPINNKKKKNPPPRSATIVNRWWRKDFITPARQRPHRDWPDIIDYLGRDYGCKVAWFGNPRFERWYGDDMA